MVMKKFLFIATSLASAINCYSQDLSVQINQGLLNYEQENSTQTLGESKQSNKTTTLQTVSNSLELVIGYSSFFFYTYPLDDGFNFAIGSEFYPGLELGITLGYFSEKQQLNDQNLSSQALGFYSVYAQELDSLGIEYGLSFGNALNKFSSNEEGSAQNETQFQSFSLSVTFVMPLNDHLSLLSGIAYAQYSEQEKITKINKDANLISLTLMAWRFDF